MRQDRGSITEITMKITYPDGFEKSVLYDSEWIKDTAAILINEDSMTDA